jgi:wyosine [tRNA(Phe)-imidazoG37] synthetase (radical SAM superfamily)
MPCERPRYVFGPVPSRRLGRSLGLDIIAYKTCTYDCIYCQLGPTTERTITPRDFAPVDEVIAQLRERLGLGDPPDVITLAGSGEPTLHSGLGAIIGAIKALTAIPLVVLTNGALLDRPEVREALLPADVVVPDLDAVSADVFTRVCRPHPQLDPAAVLAGLEQFAGDYRGRLALEVFLVEGINADDDEVKKIAALARRLRPHQVQLNTVTRPPTDPAARSVAPQRLGELARLFSPPAEVIAGNPAAAPRAASAPAGPADVLALINCHPATVDDVAAGLALTRAEAAAMIEALLADGRITGSAQSGRLYYLSAGRPHGGQP